MAVEQLVKQLSERTRDVSDHYPSPDPHVWAALLAVALDAHPAPDILDPGAGTGPWGRIAREIWDWKADIHGVELLPAFDPHPAYDRWDVASFLPLAPPKPPAGPFRSQQRAEAAWKQYEFDRWAAQQPVWTPPQQYDLIIGNPPYRYAEAFVRKSHDLLNHGGMIVFLLRLAFLEGQDRGKDFWKAFPPARVLVCSKRPSFTGNNRTDATAYMVCVWQPTYRGTPQLEWLIVEDS